jgi:hypothetical protein
MKSTKSTMTFWFKSYEARLLDLTEEDLQSCPFAQEVLRSFGAKPWPWPEKSEKWRFRARETRKMEVLIGKVR